jgi:hypothetical protein
MACQLASCLTGVRAGRLIDYQPLVGLVDLKNWFYYQFCGNYVNYSKLKSLVWV